MERVPSMASGCSNVRQPAASAVARPPALRRATAGCLTIERVEKALEAARCLLDARGRGLAACRGRLRTRRRSLRTYGGRPIGRVVGPS